MIDKNKFKEIDTLTETIKNIKNLPELQNVPICFMLIGLPASGKSTIASKIVSEMPQCINYDLDSVLIKRALKENKTYHEIVLNKRLRDRCSAQYNQNINAILKERQSFIWEQLNTAPGSRVKKAIRVKSATNKNNGVVEKSPYFLVGIYTNIPEDVLIERLYKRNEESRIDPEGKFISTKTLVNLNKEYVHPQHDEPFDLLFECDANLNLTLKPSTPFTEILAEKKISGKPSDEEIEARRAAKRALKQKLKV